MIPVGTTPTHTFTTDIDLSAAEVLYITYQQRGRTVLEKTLEDCTVTADSIVTKLTQRDTLRFKEKIPVKMQIRARFADESAVKCVVMLTDTDELLKGGEI